MMATILLFFIRPDPLLVEGPGLTFVGFTSHRMILSFLNISVCHTLNELVELCKKLIF